MKNLQIETIRLVLGDQLDPNHSWFAETDDSVLYAMFEMRQEIDHTLLHVQKIMGFFSAMRNFAAALEADGHQVLYLKINDPKNEQDLSTNIKNIIALYDARRFEYMLPDAYRLDHQLSELCDELEIECGAVDTEHFLTGRGDVKEYFGEKSYLMERFYREMRKKWDILMDDGDPIGGKWNYDEENRKKLPAKHLPPEPLTFEKDLSELKSEIDESGVEYFGRVSPDKFIWPTSRKESLKLLEFFCSQLLPNFGRYQDAMTSRSWSLYHARLSFSLNSKMLRPLEVVNEAIEEWRKRKDEINLAQLEGFVRQIIGWREYMRGIYWAKMPAYTNENFFGLSNKLPGWYWTGETNMNCLKQSIDQSLDYAYAHHIQRLMVTGNFALLAGVDPDEVDAWYLGVYIDAIHWVEITNTRGMSQFADGGLVGSKPYVSSANYIHKMSDYCKNCTYAHTKRTGENACPFNSMYWNFLATHQEKLRNNPRMGMVYRVWDKMDDTTQKDLLEQAAFYIENIEEL